MIDITRPIRAGMAVYSAEESVSIEPLMVATRDGYNLSRFTMGTHSGTHIDAPAHFIPGGATIDQIPMALLFGEVTVLTVSDGYDFAALSGDITRLILRAVDFSGLTQAQACALVQKGVRLLGIDRMSVAPEWNESDIHRTLLSSGVWLLETLTLDQVADGHYTLNCLPMKLDGLEAAPARAVLLGKR